MKILFVANYIYDNEWPEFTRNKTGFGIMVKEIYDGVEAQIDSYLYTHVITGGHRNIIKHRYIDVLKNVKLIYFIKGIQSIFCYKQTLKERMRYFYYWLDAGYLKRIIQKLNPDIVHIHGLGYTSKIYVNVCEDCNIPYVVTLHGLIGLDDTTLAKSWEKEWEKEFLKIAYEKSIPISVISSGMKGRVEQKYINGSADNIYVINNALTDSMQKEVYSISIDIKKHYKLSSDCKIALVVGSICDRKNQLQILRAIDIIKDKVSYPFVFFFCGVDTSNGEFDKVINDLRLNTYVYKLGFIPKETVGCLMDQADINVVASKDEGFGLSIVEAFSHGLPTVTFSDLDAIPDLYSEDTMLLASSREDSDFADIIKTGFERNWDKSKIKLASKWFSREKMINEYLSLYNEVLNHDF